MAIGVAIVVVRLVLTSSLSLFGGASTPPFIFKEHGYKEGNRVGYNMISIRILSLLNYFTYIFIDIIIYALASMPWSSGIL
jgi:hypothetical protein